MKTEQAYQLYLVQAQQNADFQNTILWVVFTLFVIAPLLLFAIYVPVAIARRPKCPNCGSRRVRRGIEIIKTDYATTSKNVNLCDDCHYEF